MKIMLNLFGGKICFVNTEKFLLEHYLAGKLLQTTKCDSLGMFYKKKTRSTAQWFRRQIQAPFDQSQKCKKNFLCFKVQILIYLYFNCKIGNFFTRLVSHVALSKNWNDKFGPTTCVYQMIRIKSSNKFSQIYFLGL